MKRNIILAIVLGAFAVHAAIKKEELPPMKPAEQPEKPAEKPDFLEELRKRAEGNNGRVEVKPGELEQMMRDMLEAQGIAKEKLKGADLLELLRLMRENGGLGPLEGFFGQMDPKVQRQLNDHFRSLLDGHRPGATKAATATFLLRDAKKPEGDLALGTGVHADGWLLTKASEVKGAASLQCQTAPGTWVPAKVVQTWDEHDLALLKIEAKGIAAVQWAAAPAPGVGSFLTAVAPAGSDPVAIGLVSVATRSLSDKGRGYLGVQLKSDEKGVSVQTVVPKGAAETSGVKPDDRILELDGQKPESVATFIKLISDRKAGEKVKLKLQRGAEVVEKEVQLGDRAAIPAGGRPGNDRMNNMGSTISKRRGNFPNVIQTDFPLEANQCGGPVTDLDGNIVGIVIARSGRVETLVLPGATIRELLAKVDFAK